MKTPDDLKRISDWLEDLHANHRGWFHTLLVGIVLAALGFACITHWLSTLF